MIFKNEGDVPIKKVASEGFSREALEGAPYDFRRELSERDKAAIHATLERHIRTNKWHEFVRDGLAARHLGITVPVLSNNSREKFRKDAMNWVVSPDGFEAFQQYHLMLLALFDRSIIDSFDSNIKAVFDREVAAIRTNDPRSADDYIYNEAATMIFAPDTYALPTDIREQLVQELPKRADIRLPEIVEFPEDLDTARGKLRDLALIRCIDPAIPIPLTSTHWERIRLLTKADDGINTISRAESAFHARIVAAKDVRIDKEGLHITDYERETPLPKSVSKPAPKHI